LKTLTEYNQEVLNLILKRDNKLTELIMSETIVETVFQNRPVSSVCPVNITQGDFNNRFRLNNQKGESTLSLGHDVYEKYFFAGQIETALNQALSQASQHREQFTEEWNHLVTVVEEWKQTHTNQIVMEKTRITGNPEVSSSGKIHFRFIVIKNSPIDWLNDPLDEELTRFEEKLLNDPFLKMIRLDSLLFSDLPDTEEHL
jgi:hypothetical protein